MRYLRFEVDGQVKYGVSKDNKVREADQSPFASGDFTLGRSYELENIKLLAPCKPSKIVCVGLNYTDHTEELGMQVPSVPKIFLKPAEAVIGPDDEIVYPSMANRVDYEAELAFVVKDRCKDVPVTEADDYILGYSCFNDVTARDIQRADGQWTRAKSFDSFAPFGPAIVSDVDISNLRIELFQNGEQKQDSTIADMIFTPAELLSFISKIMTLNPGDLIATGTPPGVGAMKPGDEVEVKIEKIGSLTNKVVKK